MMDAVSFMAGIAFGAALIVFLNAYINMLRPCRSGRKFMLGDLLICGERTPEGAAVKEGWIYDASMTSGYTKFTIEGLPCTFKLGRDVLFVSCERPIRVRP